VVRESGTTGRAGAAAQRVQTSESRREGSFRPELQGLRAVAVVLVVVYHVWFDRVSGGVDVFFLISGFLLTGQLVRAAERGTLDLRVRWSRMIVRLVPPMAVVLVGTVLAGAVLLPEGRWPQTVREVAAAALFVENWQLAADSVDYAARNNMASVVQHFWSLSIQGQFYVLWPLVVAVVVLSSRGAPHRLRNQLTLATAALFAVSLLHSIVLTATNQPLAYFHTLTRMWEFALGGLLALHLHAVRLSSPMRLALGWVGVAGLLICGAVLPGATVFPGVAALWPTGCAALVLLAGTTGSSRGADRLLGYRPVQYLGDLSYPLFLWHWPVLVLFLVADGREEVGLAAGLGIVAVSLVLAVLTHHLVEKPLQRQRISVRGGYRLGALATAAVLLAAGVWQFDTTRRSAAGAHVAEDLHPGALALASGPVDVAPLRPPPVSVYEDWVRIEQWDCRPMAGFPMDVCAQPVEGEPARRIVVVGDSHIQQLSGVLLPIAQRHNWQLIAMARGACPFSTASEVVADEPDCLAWNTAAADEIVQLRPDTVVTLASRDVRAGLTEQTPPGFVAQWARLDAEGIPVLAVRDNPRFDSSVPECIEQRGRGAPECGMPREAVYSPDPPWTQLADVPANVTFLDIADAVCDPTTCPGELGNVLVYLDDNHLTATYAMSIAPLMEDRVVAAVGS
jgi:peptidoglycan/LPS O-acetylase OafA/YrhL